MCLKIIALWMMIIRKEIVSTLHFLRGWMVRPTFSSEFFHSHPIIARRAFFIEIFMLIFSLLFHRRITTTTKALHKLYSTQRGFTRTTRRGDSPAIAIQG